MSATLLDEPAIDTVNRDDVEVSVVMPCLNEARTVGTCVAKARASLDTLGVRSEVIIADNGSNDGSQLIAQAHGARVVPVSRRGYGAALQGGIAAAKGRPRERVGYDGPDVAGSPDPTQRSPARAVGRG